MKTIGMIGGMSWESTQSYYRLINQGVKARLGGLHSARICLYSVDFAPIAQLQAEERWEEAGAMLADAARAVESAGAQGLLIATNTMHKVADQVCAAVSIPLLHIADATADRLLTDGVDKVALLGTRFTMEQAFYRQRLEQQGINVIIPNERQRDEVHRIIYDELCQGRIETPSRERYQQIIAELGFNGAEAVILGCTEIGLLLEPHHSALPLYDTAAIHAEAAVAWALSP
ncbi:aspartate/glutamate racemase family protein [Motiliproteus sediminis]|uniref:aspartate/glutamate racemase family protein n=1 Tax=Motiliproteus sediminis TaxID=1468178 RepID=UPI001AEF9370|nr:aspartate/glutamate racemase family protein [Motiliproteus sediminis]